MNKLASIRSPARCTRREESEMTIKPKPGNQPDPNDMSGIFENGGEAHTPATTHPDLGEEAEEEAARLGDFA